MARVQVAADALHLKPTRLRVLSSYERTSGYALDYLSTPPPPFLPPFPSAAIEQTPSNVKRRSKTMEKSLLRIYRGRKLRAGSMKGRLFSTASRQREDGIHFPLPSLLFSPLNECNIFHPTSRSLFRFGFQRREKYISKREKEMD